MVPTQCLIGFHIKTLEKSWDGKTKILIHYFNFTQYNWSKLVQRNPRLMNILGICSWGKKDTRFPTRDCIISKTLMNEKDPCHSFGKTRQKDTKVPLNLHIGQVPLYLIFKCTAQSFAMCDPDSTSNQFWTSQQALKYGIIQPLYFFL